MERNSYRIGSYLSFVTIDATTDTGRDHLQKVATDAGFTKPMIGRRLHIYDDLNMAQTIIYALFDQKLDFAS